MKLHTRPEEFRELITVVANEKHISESAVERDYYIVMMLKSLADSPYADQCVFKGGTSLSKCYPGSIDRFSEDIDLTFLGMELTDKACNKAIKKIEGVMSIGAQTEKIVEERSNRSKSMVISCDLHQKNSVFITNGPLIFCNNTHLKNLDHVNLLQSEEQENAT